WNVTYAFYVLPGLRAVQVRRIFSGEAGKISAVGGSNGEKGTHVSCASIGGDYSKAKGSSWEMGGATGGGREQSVFFAFKHTDRREGSPTHLFWAEHPFKPIS